MDNYEAFFIIGDRKLKMTVQANSEADAQQKVKDAIAFHKVVKKTKPEPDNGASDKQLKDLADIFGITL